MLFFAFLPTLPGSTCTNTKVNPGTNVNLEAPNVNHEVRINSICDLLVISSLFGAYDHVLVVN